MRTKFLADYFHAYLFDELTDRLFASNHFDSVLARWPWVKEVIAARHDCSLDDVDCVETENGDRITVKGVIVARMEITKLSEFDKALIDNDAQRHSGALPLNQRD